MAYPEDGEAEHFHDEECGPGGRGGVLAGPEEGLVDGVRLEILVVAFEAPDFLPLFVEVVPPAQSHQQSASHVLDCPEIEGAEEHHDDEGVDVAEEVAENEVAAWRRRYTKKAAALKMKVKMQAMGCAALERPPSAGLRLSWSAALALRGSLIQL